MKPNTYNFIKSIKQVAILFLKKAILLAVLLNIFISFAYSQAVYPVQVNVNLIPPYSFYFEDYTSGTRDRIWVTLLNRDTQYPSMSVRLEMTIKANGFNLKIGDYKGYPYNLNKYKNEYLKGTLGKDFGIIAEIDIDDCHRKFNSKIANNFYEYNLKKYGNDYKDKLYSIAKLINDLGDDWYKDYKKDATVKVGLSLLLDDDSIEHDFLENYLKGLELYLTRKKQKVNKIEKTDSSDDIQSVCIYFTKADYKALSLDQRLDALLKLTTSSMKDTKEKIAINLIKYVKDEDRRALLNKLVTEKDKNGKPLIVLLNSRIDNDYSFGFFGSDRYKEFIKTLTELSIENMSVTTLENLLSEDRLLYWQLPHSNASLLEARGKLNSNGEIDINLGYYEYHYDLEKSLVKVWTNAKSYSLSPFDLVVFVNTTQLPTVEEVLNGKAIPTPQGKAYIVSAIVLEYAKHMKLNKGIEFAASITLDILSVVSTSGTFALAKGAGWGRKLWLAFDAARAVSSTIIILKYDDIKDPKLKKALDWYIRIDIVLSLADIGVNAYKAGKDQIPNALSNAKEELELAKVSANKQQVNALEEAFRDQAKRFKVDWDAIFLLKTRKEFDAYGAEWHKINPFTNKEMFNSKTGGYVVCHKKHNIRLDRADSKVEFEICEALAEKGYRVELLSEKVRVVCKPLMQKLRNFLNLIVMVFLIVKI